MTMEYTDVALTSAEIAELKLPAKVGGWRLKLLKPYSEKSYVPPTTVTETINYDGSGHYPAPITAGESYRKLIYDEEYNRTFILHGIANTAATSDQAIVSVINHDLARSADGHVDTFSRDNMAGWPVTDTGEVSEWIYDSKRVQLILAVPGNYNVPTAQVALALVNAQKYGDVLSDCSGLEDNPDYMDAVFTSPDLDTVGYGGRIARMKLYDGDTVYCWIETAYFGYTRPSSGLNRVSGGHRVNQFWKYDIPGDTWTFIWQTEAIPSTYSVVDADIVGPTQFPTIDIPRSGTVGNSVLGEPANPFAVVADFHVTEDEFIFITTPVASSHFENPVLYGSRGDPARFGHEMNVIRVNKTTLEVTAPNNRTITGLPGEYWEWSEVGAGASDLVYDPGGPLPRNWWRSSDAISQDIDFPSNADGWYEVCVYRNGTWDAAIYGSNMVIQGSHALTYCWGENIDNNVLGNHYYRFLIYLRPGGTPAKAHIYTFAYDNSTGVSVAAPKPDTYTFGWGVKIRPYPLGLSSLLDQQSDNPIVDVSDTTFPNPTTADYTIPATSETFQGAVYQTETPQFTYPQPPYNAVNVGVTEQQYPTETVLVNDANGDYTHLVVSVGLETAPSHRGLWKISLDDTAAIVKLTETDLFHDYVPSLRAIGDSKAAALSTTPTTYASEYRIHYIDLSDMTIDDTMSFTDTPGSYVYPRDAIRLTGFDGVAVVTNDRIRIAKTTTYDGIETAIRDIRKYWNGGEPDRTLGATSSDSLDDLGQTPTFTDPQFTQSKGQTSYAFDFTVHGRDYLPWLETHLNLDGGATATYNELITHGTRINVERYVGFRSEYNAGRWIQEGQVFISRVDFDVEDGVVEAQVGACGIIGALVSKSVYKYTHEPDQVVLTDVALTTDDDIAFWYSDMGIDHATDWLANPEPIIYVDGVETDACEIDLSAGTVTFVTAQTGQVVTASFTYYEPGTNYAEDIILCILRHPEELGGADLDEEYFTRSMTDEELTTSDGLTYAFPKNHLIEDTLTVYRDSVDCTGDVVIDYLAGTVTFGSDQSAYTITGTVDYYTIQASGVSLMPISFTYDKYPTSLECIQEVCRRVAPNYIFREGRDGKVECDFFTQKADGEEDVVVEQTDIILDGLAEQPGYDALATRVISLGQADINNLPNLCFGKTVTDLWAYGWTSGSVSTVTDGSAGTNVSAGYGRWGEGTLAVQSALISDPDGKPMLSIDLEDMYEVKTIIVARGPGMQANEGDGGAVTAFSVWSSEDEATWVKLVGAFTLPPGTNIALKAGQNFPETTRFQYIRINCHSLGLYTWKGHTDSQMDIAEVMCFKTEILEGLAELQDTDPTADLYDTHGLLQKYGFITHVARDGQSDPALNTQAKADADAAATLEELVRLETSASLSAVYLPGVPAFSTIRVKNPVTELDETFFVESKTATEDGDDFQGNTLP